MIMTKGNATGSEKLGTNNTRRKGKRCLSTRLFERLVLLRFAKRRRFHQVSLLRDVRHVENFLSGSLVNVSEAGQTVLRYQLCALKSSPTAALARRFLQVLQGHFPFVDEASVLASPSSRDRTHKTSSAAFPDNRKNLSTADESA